MRKLMFIAAVGAAAVMVHCRSQYRPLEAADECACRVGEYCKVSPPSGAARARIECAPLPATCGARPTCDCVGSAVDACRDDDGRLTLLPPRLVASCDACSGEELCVQGLTASPFCRLLPPQCEATPSCACFVQTRQASRLACSEHDGHIVASLARR